MGRALIFWIRQSSGLKEVRAAVSLRSIRKGVRKGGGLVRESPQNPLNSGLGIIVICPESHESLDGFLINHRSRISAIRSWDVQKWQALQSGPFLCPEGQSQVTPYVVVGTGFTPSRLATYLWNFRKKTVEILGKNISPGQIPLRFELILSVSPKYGPQRVNGNLGCSK